MLLRFTISELITLLHNQETAKTNSTNNSSILARSTEPTINYHKKTIALFYSVNQSLSPHYNTSLLSLTTLYSIKKKPRRLIYKSKKNNPENARAKSREKEKKALLSYVTGQRNSSKKLDLLDQCFLIFFYLSTPFGQTQAV